MDAATADRILNGLRKIICYFRLLAGF